MKITANEVIEGDTLVGLDNGYVIEVEESNGYLASPRTDYGIPAAMPADTLVITFHDAEGNENYLLASPTLELEVNR